MLQKFSIYHMYFPTASVQFRKRNSLNQKMGPVELSTIIYHNSNLYTRRQGIVSNSATIPKIEHTK